MKYKQRILRGPKRPSFFKSPLFSFFILAFVCLIALYRFTGKEILEGLSKKGLSIHLGHQGEALSHIIYHQFFLLGLKKEDVKVNLKKVEKGNVSWNLYQVEVLLPSVLTVQQVKASLENEIKSSFPALSLQSRLLEKEKHQLIIKENEFILSELVLIPSAEIKASRVESRPLIAIVIDDLGPNLSLAREFLSLHYPLTFSILPFYTHSKAIAAEAHSQGREVMLHLPLEPLNNEENRPEKGTLYTSMDEDKLLKQLRVDLTAFPYLSGINGHMGSKFTGDRKSMEILLRELKSRGLFFLDSLTTGKSVGSSVAQEIKITFGKRDLFLDRELGGSTIEDRFVQLAHIAKKKGYAIGIAHPYPDTLNALKKMLPLLSSEGIEVFPVSQIIGHVTEKKRAETNSTEIGARIVEATPCGCPIRKGSHGSLPT